MADDNNSGNNTIINSRNSVGTTAVQPFRVPLLFIDKNTTINAKFATKNYHYHVYFDPLKVHQLRHNLSTSYLQQMNSANNDIGHVINIYHNVVNRIKDHCRRHLHDMICKRCKDINWVLEGGKEPKSMDDVWKIHHTKQNMIQEDGG